MKNNYKIHYLPISLMLLFKKIKYIISRSNETIKKTYSFLDKKTKKYIKNTFIVIVFSGISDGFFVLLGSVYISTLFNTLSGNKDLKALELPLLIEPDMLSLSLMFITLILINLILKELATKRISLGTSLITHCLTNKILNNLLNNNIESVELMNSSKKISTLVVQTDLASASVIDPFLRAISSIFSGFIVILSMLYINVISTLLAAFILLSYYVLNYSAVKTKLSEISKSFVVKRENFIRAIQEAIQGIRYLKVYNSTSSEISKISKLDLQLRLNHAVKEYYGILPRIRLESMIFLAISLYGVFVSFSSDQISNTIGILVLCLGGFKLLPMLQNVYHSVYSVTALQKSLFEVLELAQPNKTSLSSSLSSSCREELYTSTSTSTAEFKSIRSLTLNQINYSIDSNNHIIADFSHKFYVGKVNIVEGKSGVGKSTLLDIISGLRVPESGSIIVQSDSTMINNEYSTSSAIHSANYSENLLELAAYSGQSPYIIEDTVLNNIRYPDFKNNRDIDKALYYSCIDQILLTNPKWLSHNCGEGGSAISGGQALRISIARAVLKDSPILIFDEPTSGLDIHNQELFFKRIQTLCDHKLIIMSIHRKDVLIEKAERFILKKNNLY